MSLVYFKIQPTRANIEEVDVYNSNNFYCLVMNVLGAYTENRPIIIYGCKSRSQEI